MLDLSLSLSSADDNNLDTTMRFAIQGLLEGDIINDALLDSVQRTTRNLIMRVCQIVSMKLGARGR